MKMLDKLLAKLRIRRKKEDTPVNDDRGRCKKRRIKGRGKRTTEKDGESKKRVKKRGKFFKTIRVCLFSFIGLCVAGVAAFFIFFDVGEWHKFDESRILNADQTTVFLDADGNTISRLAGGENRLPIKVETLPEHVIYAFVSAEDARFFEHNGIDIIRIFGAAWADIKAGGKVQGASTIGQQLIKLSHLTSEKTFERKLEEAYLSISMEHKFDKNEIMEMYLNYVYFGGGYYGIESAALGYFGIHARELSAAQAAQLAGILKSPGDYAPHLNMEKSLKRRDNILALMLKYGHLTQNEYKSAIEEECVLKNEMRSIHSYSIDYAITEACSRFDISREEFLSGGYTVYTTISPTIEEEMSMLLSSDACPENAQAAGIVLRTDGSIAGIYGGSSEDGEYSAYSFNRAADMQRQPGSLIKPLICYAPALESSAYTAASVFKDEPTDFDGYSPGNSGGKYHGFVTMRTALINSLNIPAVKLLSEIGIDNGIEFAKKLGISFQDEKRTLALALGGFTYGVSPIEIAGAYNAFAANGLYRQPYSVAAIYKGDKLIYFHNEAAERVMRDTTAFLITDMLREAAQTGTAKALSALPFSVAAKTGTNLGSDGSVRDVWTAAYTPLHTVILWMGTDSAKSGSLPDGFTGGNSVCKVVKDLFEAIYEKTLPTDFTEPEGIVRVSIDRLAAERGELLAATEYSPDYFIECFAKGTEPTESDPFRRLPTPPSYVAVHTDKSGYPVIEFDAADERYIYQIFRVNVSGEERIVAELKEQSGVVSYCDRSIIFPDSVFEICEYGYFIKTLHPEIAVNGKNAVSKASRLMTILVCKVFFG